MSDITNDNHDYPSVVRPPEPDAHGQAAILLVESLIHCLVERSVITMKEAVEIVETAADVKADIAFDLGDSPETVDRSLNLLSAISESLKHDR